MGTVAIFTNCGIILEEGGISQDGVYYENDSELPVYYPAKYNSTYVGVPPNPHDILCQFKMLFTNNELLIHNNFRTEFITIIDNNDVINVWRNIESKLETSEGRQLIAQKNFKVHAIVNMRSKNSARWSGISINNEGKNIGRDGTVYLNNSSLILVAGPTKMKLS